MNQFTPDAARVLRLLAAGKTTQQTADATSWPRDRVKALGLAQKGWLYDAEADEMYAPNTPDGSLPLPAGLAEQAGPGRIEAVLARAEASADPKLRRLAATARIAVDGITERLMAEQQAAALAMEIDRLQRQLADRQAKHRELTGRKTPGARTGTPPGVGGKERRAAIRAWAAEEGMPCPSGRIPQTTITAYNEAHGGTSE